MKLKAGIPFSLWRTPNPPSYQKLSADQTCDVAVVGAGISGALIGHAFARFGKEVVWVDRRQPGQGSTAASTGFLQYELDVNLSDLAKRLGRPIAERAYRLCRDSIFGLREVCRSLQAPGLFERRKSLYLCTRSKDLTSLKAEFRARRNMGLQVELLTARDLRETWGVTASAAILSSDAGTVDAFALTHRLLEDGVRRGGRVFGTTTVTRYQPSPKWITLVTATGFTIRARRVIMATGYEAMEHLKRPLARLKNTYVMITEPGEISTRLKKTLVWETARPYFYLRSTGEGHFMAGGEDSRPYPLSESTRLLQVKARRLHHRLSQFLGHAAPPQLGCWAGAFASTRDGLPYIGETPEFPRATFALGYGGNGITFSQIAAELLVNQERRRGSPELNIFRFDR